MPNVVNACPTQTPTDAIYCNYSNTPRFFPMVDKNRRRQPAAKQAKQATPATKKPAVAQPATQQKPQTTESLWDSIRNTVASLPSTVLNFVGLGDEDEPARQTAPAPVKLPDYTGMYQVIPAADVMTQRDFASYPFAQEIATAAERLGVNPYVLMAMAQQESKLSTQAVSPTGVKGIGQVTKLAFDEAFPKEMFPGQTPDRRNPLHSIYAMGSYLRSFAPDKRYKIPDDITAIRAYNMGPEGAKNNKSGKRGRKGSMESFFYSPDIIQRLNLLRLPYSDTARVGPNALPVPAIYGQRLQQDYDNAARLGLNLDRKAMTGQLVKEKQKMLNDKAYAAEQFVADMALFNREKNLAAKAMQAKNQAMQKQQSKGKK